MEVAQVDKLCSQIAELRSNRDELSEKEKAIQKHIDALEQNLLEALTELDKSSWEVTGVGLFSVVSKKTFSVVDADKLREWMLQNDLSSMLSVNSRTLSSWAKDREDLIHDEVGIKPNDYTTISFRRK